MKFIEAIIILLIMGNTISSHGQDIEAQIHKQIKKILRYEVDLSKKETPGFLVAIIEPDTAFVVSYGKQVGSSSLPDSSQSYEMGGLSKVFLSVIANQLHNEGKINLNDKISEVFPQAMTSELADITALQLLQHTSGIKRGLKGIADNLSRKQRGLSLHSPKGFSNENEDLTEEELWLALHKTPLGIRGHFLYSHYNYALLSLWIEKTTHKTLQEHANDIYIADKKLNELFSLSSTNKANGISKYGKQKSDFTYGVLEYSIGLESTMESLIYIIQKCFLQDQNPTAVSLLSEPIDTEIAKHIYFTKGMYKIKQGKKYTIFSHGGHSLSHSASIHFVPETKTGLVILANSEIGTKDLYLSLLTMINENWKREPYGQEK